MRGIPRIWLALESERDSTARAEGARLQSYEQRFLRIPNHGPPFSECAIKPEASSGQFLLPSNYRSLFAHSSWHPCDSGALPKTRLGKHGTSRYAPALTF